MIRKLHYMLLWINLLGAPVAWGLTLLWGIALLVDGRPVAAGAVLVFYALNIWIVLFVLFRRAYGPWRLFFSRSGTWAGSK